jgi:hypothetical protein
MKIINLPPEAGELLDLWRNITSAESISTGLLENTVTLLNTLATAEDLGPTLDTCRQDLATSRQEITRISYELSLASSTLAAAQAREVDHMKLLAQALASKDSAGPAPAPAPSPRMEKIPNPERFDGTRTKLRQFITQLRLKAATYTDEQAKLRLATNSLTGEALEQIQPFVQNDRIDLPDLAGLITILDTAFGNPNRVAEAEAKLATIQQGTREFSSYYAEFQRHAAEVTWDDVAKLAAFRRGLSYRLKSDLISVPEKPTTIAAFVALCNRLDIERRALQSESNRPTPSTSRPRTSTTPVPSTQSGTHAGPMDLSANRKNSTASPLKVSPEERAKRMAEGRCYRCGEVGHISRECPIGNKAPLKAAATSTEASTEALKE